LTLTPFPDPRSPLPDPRSPIPGPRPPIPDPRPDVAVIVVNFNTGEETIGCIASALLDLGAVRSEVFVVDNASSDGSAELLGSDSTITLIANQTNRGFGAAVNQAAKLARAPLFWILNPDCRVLPGAYRALLNTLERHSDCAIAAPQLLNADGSVQASARGEPDAWTGLFGRHGLLTKFFPQSGGARKNLPAADLVASGVESAEVPWVMGAAMLVRREAFERIGRFDERYFLYWEDADLCRRLRLAAWTIRYVPGARVNHPGGASANTASRLAIRAFHESAYRYYSTHVVRSPGNPLRLFAKAALGLRARWRMRHAKN
jgi:N-acetylglucosaminyl-diphospho-decaprenol L-rhamnosyltransferase